MHNHRRTAVLLAAGIIGLTLAARADEQALEQKIQKLEKRIDELEGNSAVTGGTNDAS